MLQKLELSAYWYAGLATLTFTVGYALDVRFIVIYFIFVCFLDLIISHYRWYHPSQE